MPEFTASSSGRAGLSIVVPAYNEEEVLVEFHRRLSAVVDRLDLDIEVIYVNDGSRDGTLDLLRHIRAGDGRVAIVDLSRNFGKEIALTAGLDHARGDAVVVIDADLQDPPELIPDLVECWQDGNDIVYARRISRAGETFLKRFSAAAFYNLMQRIGPVRVPPDTGDFRILSRRAVDALLTLREQHRFMKGLFAWIGFRQREIAYHRDPRFAGVTKYNYWKLWNFSIEGITSFTIGPLKAATYLGLVTASFAFGYGLVVVYKTLAFGESVAGYPSMMVTMLFLGGVQLMFLGILGEYIGRMFNETKRRPLYFVQSFDPPVRASAEAAEAEAVPAT